MKFEALVDLVMAAQTNDDGAANEAKSSGFLTLRWEGDFQLHIEQVADGDLVHLHAPLHTLTKNDPENLLRLLLEAHTFGYATKGAYFGYDRKRAAIVLFQNLALGDFDAQSFNQVLENFIEQLQFWREALPNLQPTAEPSHPALQTIPEFGGRV